MNTSHLATARDTLFAPYGLTDGDIEYPHEDMPYRVLWVLPARGGFSPPYGVVIGMEGEPQ